jgi:hypothetical protein
MYRVPARSAHPSIGAFRTYAGRATSRNASRKAMGTRQSALDVLGPGPRGQKAHIFDILLAGTAKPTSTRPSTTGVNCALTRLSLLEVG